MLHKCPYCQGDLDRYRLALKNTRGRGPVSHRGMLVRLERRNAGFGFSLNDGRYTDKRSFLFAADAYSAAADLIDEMLNSAKVVTLEDD